MNEVKYLIIPLLCVMISQTIKFVIESTKYHKLDFRRLLDGAGGMPSTHSTLVSSLTTLVGLNYGFNNILFSICTIFSLVILYDAMGVRYETGKQAEIINVLIKNTKFKTLKEKIGHKPFEVLCGVILGITMAIILNSIFS